MVAVVVIWIIVLAVFAYVYWKPGFKTSTQMIKFAGPPKTGPQGELRSAEEAQGHRVSSTQPS